MVIDSTIAASPATFLAISAITVKVVTALNVFALAEREQFIITERRLSDGGRTLESLGEELGLSKERVRQLEAAAFAKMRKSLNSNDALKLMIS